MARYQAIINTDDYKLMPCSKKNWEAGTINDFILAINGWKSTERSLQEVRWRIEMLFWSCVLSLWKFALGKVVFAEEKQNQIS